MNQSKKALSLNKETLRQLGDHEMRQAAGGTIDLGLLQIALQLIFNTGEKDKQHDIDGGGGGKTTISIRPTTTR